MGIALRHPGVASAVCLVPTAVVIGALASGRLKPRRAVLVGGLTVVIVGSLLALWLMNVAERLMQWR